MQLCAGFRRQALATVLHTLMATALQTVFIVLHLKREFNAARQYLQEKVYLVFEETYLFRNCYCGSYNCVSYA